MARKPSFQYTKTPSGWKVEIPARIASSGKRERAFFRTRDEAKNFSAKLRADYDDHGTKASVISPSLADEAVRAIELLEPYGVTLLEAARIVAKSKEEELSSKSIDFALEEFIKSKSKIRARQRKAYEYMKRDLLESFSGMLLSSISGDELIVHAEKYGTTPSSYNGLIRLLKAFWRWCAKPPREWCDGKRAEVLEHDDDDVRDEIGVLDCDQCTKLLNAAVEHYPECVPGFAIALFTGMRKSELGRLKRSNIKDSGITLSRAVTKTLHRRFIEMPSLLKVWLRAYPLAETVLPNSWQKKEKAVRRLAGWGVWSELVEPNAPPEELAKWPHNALRHTHASVHVALGKPLEALNFEFGHSGGTKVLKEYYVGVMSKAEAKKIMKIRPK